MTDEVLRELIQSVAKLEVRGGSMDKRMDEFQGEMKQIADNLKATTKTLNAIRNVLVVFVVAIIASGSELKMNIPLILKSLGVG